MQKNKVLKIIFLFVVTLFAACSNSQQVVSTPTGNDIKIDGDHSDWKQLTNMKGENISFGFSNDAENLYLTLITNDRNKIMKIMRGGLEVWIDTGKPENRIGIRFPEKPDPAEMMEQMKKQRMNRSPDANIKNPEEMLSGEEVNAGIKQFLARQKELFVVDDDGMLLGTFPINGDQYKASISIDKTNFCYELKIPFGIKPSLNIDKELNPAKVSVDFISGNLQDDFENMRGQGGMDGEGGMPQGGPPPPGGGNMGQGDGRGMNRMGSNNTSQIDYSFEVLINQ